MRGVFSVARMVSTTAGRTALIRRQQSLPFWDVSLSGAASLALTVMSILFLEYPPRSAQTGIEKQALSCQIRPYFSAMFAEATFCSYNLIVR